jgi:RNA polymerase sigma-70 factor (ECF subfamily)
MPAVSLATADGRFEAAYERHREPLLRWLRSRTRDDAVAEDICQEAYARLLCQLRFGKAPDSDVAWLHTVARNLLVSGARRERVARVRTPVVQETDGGDPTADLALTRHELDGVAMLLERIPRHHRPLLAMAAAGLTTAEIAARLGTRAGAARTRLHRARLSLRAQLATQAALGPC